MIVTTAIGRLTKDAEVFTYGQGKSGINFCLACNDPMNPDGDANFLNCVIFGRDQNLAQYLTMGNQIIAHGNLSLTNDGKGNYYTKLIVNNFEFGAKKAGGNHNQNYQQNNGGYNSGSYNSNSGYGNGGYGNGYDDGYMPY